MSSVAKRFSKKQPQERNVDSINGEKTAWPQSICEARNVLGVFEILAIWHKQANALSLFITLDGEKFSFEVFGVWI